MPTLATANGLITPSASIVARIPELGAVAEGNAMFVGVRRTVNEQEQILHFDQTELIERSLEKFGLLSVRSKFIPGDPNIVFTA